MLQHSTARALLPQATPMAPVLRRYSNPQLCSWHRAGRSFRPFTSSTTAVTATTANRSTEPNQPLQAGAPLLPPLQLYNTLSRQKEVFTPRPSSPNRIQMYVCGVTVYDYSHIGHARVYVAFDVLYRLLRHMGYEVQYVRNFTDIDDKIIARANERGEDPLELSQRFIHEFHADMAALGCLPPTHEPKATDYIPQMVETIERIVRNGHGYVVEGDVYFDVGSLPGYGKLSGRSQEDNRAGERVSVDGRKKGPADFALWKSAKPGEPFWPSPWGAGRPGWHIECSSMIESIMGPTIDIHGGGRDLIFPHHENEMAQSRAAAGSCSCCPPPTTHTTASTTSHTHTSDTTPNDTSTSAAASTSTPTVTSTSTPETKASTSNADGADDGGAPLARFWVHNGFVNIDSEKMSKSLGNFFTIRDVLQQYHPLALRWFLVGTQYRAPVNYTQRALEEASDRLYYVYQTLQDVEEGLGSAGDALQAAEAQADKLAATGKAPAAEITTSCLSALRDDLNTAMVISHLSGPLKAVNDLLHTKAGRKQKDRLVHLVGLQRGLVHVLRLLGLMPEVSGHISTVLSELRQLALTRAGLTEVGVEEAIEKRAEARKAKDFATSDSVRLALASKGVMIMDTPQGTTWRPGVPSVEVKGGE